MAAVIGLSRDAVETLCEEARVAGVIQPANFNSPGQVAVSGSKPAVDRAIELAKEMGAKKAVELSVGGAFHSALMESAAQRMENALKTVAISPARIPVIANVSAEPVQDAETLRTSLARQIVNPVLWEDSMNRMHELNIDLYLEVGPGKVLRGLMRRIHKDAEVLCLGDVTGLENFLRERKTWDT